MNTSIKSLRQRTGMTQDEFARRLSLSIRTLQNWECGTRECPQYLLNLIGYYLKHENLFKPEEDITVIGKVKVADRAAALSLCSERTEGGTVFCWEAVYKMPDGQIGLIQWDGQQRVFQPLDDFKRNAEGIRTQPMHDCRAITRDELKKIPFCSAKLESLCEVE